MRKIVTLLLVLLLAASSTVAVLTVKAEARTIVVPDDYSTITDAVGNATDGDTIFVKRGTYEIKENSIVINKPLSIIGEDPTGTVIVFPPDNRTGYELLFLSKIGFRVNADNFKISSLTITNCDLGVSVNGNEAKVSNTKMPGISVSGLRSLISDNTVTSTLTIKGSYNTITRNYGNIQIEGDFNVIAENTAPNNLNLQGSNNIIMRNSVLIMYMEDANLNMVIINSLSCIYVGIYGRACSNNMFSNNRVIGPGIWGISMGCGSYNVFHDNLIFNYTGSHSGYGIAIGGRTLVAEYNTFYRNILVNNNRHVSANWKILGAGNSWDNGIEGNYWDDYNGSDVNGDGIGDVPYIVAGLAGDNAGGHVNFVFGQDNYPLMAPFDIDNFSFELPAWASALLNPSPEPTPTPTPASSPTPTPTSSPAPPESEPFPTASVAAVSAAAALLAGVGVLVYVRRRKRQVAGAS